MTAALGAVRTLGASMPYARLSATFMLAFALAAVPVGSARGEGPTDPPASVEGDNRQATPTGPRVALTVTGFSTVNAEAIRAQQPALDERLAFLTDSTGVRVSIELARGSAGSLVTVDERMDAPLDLLGFVQGPMGHRAIKLGRASLTATYVNAWVGIGPVRAAVGAGNMALAEALGNRAILVRYTNGRGAVLAMSFTPAYNGQATFEGLAWVTEGKATTEVPVDARTGLVALPTGADGRPTPAAAVYRFFEVAP
ncbi:MAG: hypothetical protein Q8P18_24950 [Pseudomonadota bacterium]|nr:hypothetical protein [Pseudomonadota bacterium]